MISFDFNIQSKFILSASNRVCHRSKSNANEKVESIYDEGIIEVLIDIVSNLDDDSSAFQLTQVQRALLFESNDESIIESNLEN